MRPGFISALHHAPRDQVKLSPAVHPFANARLVGDHENVIPGVRQQLHRFQRAGNKMKVLHLCHIQAIARKFIDHAITVQKDYFHVCAPGTFAPHYFLPMPRTIS